MNNLGTLPNELKTHIIDFGDKSTFNSLSKLNKETTELVYPSFLNKQVLKHINPLDLYSYRLVINEKCIDNIMDGYISAELIFEILGMKTASMLIYIDATFNYLCIKTLYCNSNYNSYDITENIKIEYHALKDEYSIGNKIREGGIGNPVHMNRKMAEI